MRPSIRHIVLSLTVLGFAASLPAFVDAEADPKTQVADGTSRASVVVMLRNESGSRVQPVEIQGINALVTSSTFLDPIMKSALNLEPNEWPKVATIEVAQAGANGSKIILTITPPEGKGMPSAQAVLSNLTARLIDTFKSMQPDREARANAIAELKSKLDALAAEGIILKQRQNELQMLPRSTEGAISTERLKRDLKEKQDRLEQTRKLMRDLQAQSEPLVDAMKQVVVAHQEALDLIAKKMAEHDDPQLAIEWAKIRIALAEAQLRIVQQSMSSDRATGVNVIQLESEIDRLARQVAEREAPTTQPTIDPQKELSTLVLKLQEIQEKQNDIRNKMSQMQQEEQRAGAPTELVIIAK